MMVLYRAWMQLLSHELSWRWPHVHSLRSISNDQTAMSGAVASINANSDESANLHMLARIEYECARIARRIMVFLLANSELFHLVLDCNRDATAGENAVHVHVWWSDCWCLLCLKVRYSSFCDLLNRAYPEAVRLSVHALSPSARQIGITLLPVRDVFQRQLLCSLSTSQVFSGTDFKIHFLRCCCFRLPRWTVSGYVCMHNSGTQCCS